MTSLSLSVQMLVKEFKTRGQAIALLRRKELDERHKSMWAANTFLTGVTEENKAETQLRLEKEQAALSDQIAAAQATIESTVSLASASDEFMDLSDEELQRGYDTATQVFQKALADRRRLGAALRQRQTAAKVKDKVAKMSPASRSILWQQLSAEFVAGQTKVNEPGT